MADKAKTIQERWAEEEGVFGGEADGVPLDEADAIIAANAPKMSSIDKIRAGLMNNGSKT